MVVRTLSFLAAVALSTVSALAVPELRINAMDSLTLEHSTMNAMHCAIGVRGGTETVAYCKPTGNGYVYFILSGTALSVCGANFAYSEKWKRWEATEIGREVGHKHCRLTSPFQNAINVYREAK